MTLAQTITKMSLKVLYTVDNETNTYLTRSKAPLEVRVGQVPSPSNESTQLSIGMIELHHVLHEMCNSSPELFAPNVDHCMDYNVYCRDVCEAEEPFVSYGLLSKLRQASHLSEPTEEAQDEECAVVVGRVCSNFSALFRSKSSAGTADEFSSTTKSSPQTLEIKLRLSSVATASSSRRASISNSSKKPVSAEGKQNGMPPKKPFKTQLQKSQMTSKRQTNPRPAPKAVRTQSLPIWNQNRNPQFVLPANSIAHRIYLADRMTKESETGKETTADKKPVIFQINSLQNDNTVQKTKVDDSISKRFDFINKKKMKPVKPSNKKMISKSKASSAKKGRTDSITTIETPLSTSTIQTSTFALPKAAGITPSEFKILPEESVMEEILGTQRIRGGDFFEFHQEKPEDMDNKENIPPRPMSLSSRFEDLLEIDLPDLKTPNDIEKFSTNAKEDDTMDWFNSLFGSPLTTQKEDPQTCNTLPIEEEDHDTNRTITSDIDRTSPIDTLSMPLLELDHQKQKSGNRATLSCKDQLRRLPLLSKTSKREEDEDEDATSSVKQYSTSPRPNNQQFGAKRPPPVPSSPIEDEEYLDEITKQRLKKRKTMPSSPTSMFPYREDVDGDEGTNHGNTSINEEFSFRNECGLENVDSTPATQYRSSDLDHVKLGDDNSVGNK